MKKVYIKLIVCILILIMSISTTAYAADKYPAKDSDFATINDYYKSVSGNLSNIPKDVLESWLETVNKEYDLRKNSNGKYLASEIRESLRLKEFIGAEIEGRGEVNVEFWEPTVGGGHTKLYKKAGSIVGIIQVFGSVVSVGALAIIGIKYMLGSVYEKAKYKESMMPYIIGCIMLFGITNIASILYKIGTQV